MMSRLDCAERCFPQEASNRAGSAMSLAVAVMLAFGGTATTQAAEFLTHHVRNVAAATEVGRLPANQLMSLDVVLPVRDKSALDAFVAEVTNPASPNFRHYLTPAEFTAKFGPSQTDYDTTVQYLVKSGLKIKGGNLDRRDIQVEGSVSAVETAFNVKMRTYRHPTENRLFFGPDREPSTSLAIPLWHISGLDNYSIPHPLFVKRSEVARRLGVSPDAVGPRATTGSGPSASFLGSDMRAAYYGGTQLTGAGQHLGLLEYYGTDLDDLTTYFNNVHQTNHVPITLTSTDGTSTDCTEANGCDDGEQTLDMTQAIGMAPGLAGLTMYVGGTDTAIISAMTTDNPLPRTIGCSWGWTPADPSTLDQYFEQMAAQGQTFFAASGDSSTWSSQNEAWPADDAYVVSVGGTDLTTGSAAGAWASETAWADSGGGKSPDGIAIPSWQAIRGVINSSNKGSTTLRNGPDVSANADFTFYVCGDQTDCTANEYGGTSFAAPMWAGYIALVNQQAAANGRAPVGFINPVIYAANEVNGQLSSTYKTTFHDVTKGTSGSYSAATGYDLVTGWGSPRAALITTLAP
ncbi:hypothetical protein D7S89_19125 [Trinickia fusca]|uniref:Peptidase S53 domain-containing protein n=2 Tax=Trinickia fusca TaxID=2419777 RepID=A0A494X5W5_9BURK|nr:hypothetical protein D7S89_19125 [Trinickia fusca]